MGLDNPIHIAFLLILLLLVFGAKRLPEMGRSLGSGMRGFKDSLSGDSPHPATTVEPQPAATQGSAQAGTPAPAAALAPLGAPAVAPAAAPVLESVGTPSAPAA